MFVPVLPEPSPGFSTSHVVVFICVQRVKVGCDVIIGFVDIGGKDDQLFIIQ
jgi:hypothetical protein